MKRGTQNNGMRVGGKVESSQHKENHQNSKAGVRIEKKKNEHNFPG